MSALRVMTFNVQMLPLAAMIAAGQSNDAEARARWVAGAILDIPRDEQPDVIAFNEVFSEDGRSVLLSRLRGDWPHIIEKLDSGGLEEDSGLMLFSRLPFLQLPTGGERVFVTLERNQLHQVGFDVIWKSPLSFLDLDEPLYLFVNDESGPDIFGADEPEMQINIDSSSPPVFYGVWDDADTGERWPFLAESIKGRIATKMPGVTRVGFTEGIHVSYIEPDFPAASWLSQTVNPLSPGERDKVVRTISLPVPDTLSDGLYTFTCTITRFP